MRLGGELKRERRLRQMDQVQAAAVMRVSQQTVSKWENGGRPDPEHLSAIASFLNRDVEDVAVLAYAEPDRPPEPILEQRLRAIEEEMRALRADVARLLDALGPGRGHR